MVDRNDLPTDIDLTYPDLGDASRKLHQQYHDTIHEALKDETTPFATQAAVDDAIAAQATEDRGTYRQVAGLPQASGGDDLAALNAVLSANGGKIVAGSPGQTYLLSGPLVVRAGTTLDMTGCTVRLQSLANSNIIKNFALANPAATGTATTVDGSATVTTALAVAAVIGQTLTVDGATSGGYQALCGLVVAVDTGAGTVTLDVPASASVAAATAKLYTRDSAITVVGGTWDRADNQGTDPTDYHSICLRHIDGFTLRDMSFTSTAGKYSISAASCTDGLIEHISLEDTFSDGIHLDGPTKFVTIRDIYGKAGDDFVAITAEDWHQYGDVTGDVTDITIQNLYPNETTQAAVKVLAGPGGTAKRITIEDVYGSANSTGGAVWVGDDATQPETMGGRIDDITVRNVACVQPDSAPLLRFNGTNMGRVTVDGVTYDSPSSTTAAIVIDPASAATIDSLTVLSLKLLNIGEGQDVIYQGPNSTVTRMLLADWDLSAPQGFSCLEANKTITHLRVQGFRGQYQPPTGSGSIVWLNTSGTTVGKLLMSDMDITGNGSSELILALAATHVLPYVAIANSAIDGLAWVVGINTTTKLLLNGIHHINPGAGAGYFDANSVVTLWGAGNNIAAGGQGLHVVTGGSLTNHLVDALT